MHANMPLSDLKASAGYCCPAYNIRKAASLPAVQNDTSIY